MDNYRRLKKFADTKILKETEWISLIDRDGYIYSHESRCYKNATVALLPYRMHNNKLEFLIRYEYCPAHYINKKMEATCITGGYDDNSISISQTALKELLEEGGYDCELNELIALDWCWEGKASDTKVYLYSIDLTDKDRQQASGDGSDGEKGTYCKWESYDKIKKYRCMRLNSILFKLREVKPNLWQKED